MLNIIIVDDEELARERLKQQLSKTDFSYRLLGEASSGTKAIELIETLCPNVVFLDIQMPGLNGFDVIRRLPAPKPHIVFVTAYDDYAINAFSAHASDYLTKPVRLERLIDCLNHLIHTHPTLQSEDRPHTEPLSALAQSPLQRLTVHIGQRLKVVSTADIIRVEAEEKLVYISTAEGRFRCDFTLDDLEDRLDQSLFIRIHRQHMIQIEHVKEIIPWSNGGICVRLRDETLLPVARRRAGIVKAIFKGA